MLRPCLPRWFTYLTALALFCLAACWITAAIIAFIPPSPQPHPTEVPPFSKPEPAPPQIYSRLVSLGVVFFGITMILALIHTASAGWIYFGPLRRKITRRHDPRLFWTAIVLLMALTLAITAFGLYHVIN